jgi:hypothetical protein
MRDWDFGRVVWLIIYPVFDEMNENLIHNLVDRILPSIVSIFIYFLSHNEKYINLSFAKFPVTCWPSVHLSSLEESRKNFSSWWTLESNHVCWYTRYCRGFSHSNSSSWEIFNRHSQKILKIINEEVPSPPNYLASAVSPIHDGNYLYSTSTSPDIHMCTYHRIR